MYTRLVRLWLVWSVFGVPFTVNPCPVTLLVGIVTAVIALLLTGFIIATSMPAYEDAHVYREYFDD